jgi:DNA-binding NtrC family response regulator
LRELANVVERAVVLATGDEMGLEVLPEEIVEGASPASTPGGRGAAASSGSRGLTSRG